jgi:hypothetical protein
MDVPFRDAIKDLIDALKFWHWQKVRRADIPTELRERFEQLGEPFLANSMTITNINPVLGAEVMGLIQQKRREIADWLTEKRDIRERREDRLETVEVAILIFVALEVLHDYVLAPLFR